MDILGGPWRSVELSEFILLRLDSSLPPEQKEAAKQKQTKQQFHENKWLVYSHHMDRVYIFFAKGWYLVG